MFDDAWRLINEAMTGATIGDQSLVWAHRNELAAALLAERLGFSRAHNAEDAMVHLDRALNIHPRSAPACRVRREAGGRNDPFAGGLDRRSYPALLLLP